MWFCQKGQFVQGRVQTFFGLCANRFHWYWRNTAAAPDVPFPSKPHSQRYQSSMGRRCGLRATLMSAERADAWQSG